MRHEDKLSLTINGRTLLDSVLQAWPEEANLVAVGPERPTARSVTWCREEPVGGGPVAAIQKGLTAVRSDMVVLVGGDMPLIAPAVPVLLSAGRTAIGEGHDGAWAVSADGRPQPLASCLLTSALRAVVPVAAGGQALLPILSSLQLCPVVGLDEWLLDADTSQDFEQIKQRLNERKGTTHD
jgi:molybdenum cofactor guanylyltransferase